MEKNKQQDNVTTEDDFPVLCRCNGEMQQHVCCCAHKGGSGCQNACCKSDPGNLNRPLE